VYASEKRTVRGVHQRQESDLMVPRSRGLGTDLNAKAKSLQHAHGLFMRADASGVHKELGGPVQGLVRNNFAHL
jgi:hypothetical protein